MRDEFVTQRHKGLRVILNEKKNIKNCNRPSNLNKIAIPHRKTIAKLLEPIVCVSV